MNATDFGKILDDRIAKIRGTLASKRDEYATNLECLSNFKRGAALLGKDPAEYLAALMTKHVVSIYDLVANHANKRLNRPSAAVIDEKIGDAVNYLILLEAVLKDTP